MSNEKSRCSSIPNYYLKTVNLDRAGNEQSEKVSTRFPQIILSTLAPPILFVDLLLFSQFPQVELEVVLADF